MQNSNPTILNAADLPTRQRSLPSCKTDPYDGVIFANAWSSNSSLSEPAAGGCLIPSESASDDDLLEEPIDEQEIYGMSSHTVRLCPFPSRRNTVKDRSDIGFHGPQTLCPPFQIPNTPYP